MSLEFLELLQVQVLKRSKLGGFYNWNAIDTNKLAPVGWHVPSLAEWQTLSSHVGGNASAIKEGTQFNSIYTALCFGPDKYGVGHPCPFYFFNDFVSFGTSTIQSSTTFKTIGLSRYNNDIEEQGSNCSSGVNIRCVKD